MNILFFMNHYPDSRNGGIENVTRMLSEKFKQYGHNVDVAFLSKSEFDNSDNSVFRKVSQANQGDICKTIRDWISIYKIDIIINRCVICASPILREAIGKSNCKLVTTYNNKPTLKPPTFAELWRNNQISLITKLLCSATYPLFYVRSKGRLRERHQKSYVVSDKTILLSQRYVSEYSELMRIDSSRIEVKNNPIRDTLIIGEEELLRKQKTVLMVTRLDETQKCVIKALKIWKSVSTKHHDWTLKIIGNGPDENSIKRYVTTNDIKNVEFIPACNPDCHYKEASIFLMTSRNEGWPNTINEAMRVGCVPVVISTFSAVFDMIDSGNDGVIIPSTDNEIFESISALEMLISNSNTRMKMAENAIVKTERLSIQCIADEWISLLEEL